VNVGTIASLLARRHAWSARDHWTTEQLADHRRAELDSLRRHATAVSPFYRRLHRGLERSPLHELPPVSKEELMRNFDDVITRPIGLSDLEQRLADITGERDPRPDRPWRGLRIAATGGTTGRRGVFAWDRAEWVAVLTSYARANDWAGIPAGVRHRLPVAIVSTTMPTHQSAVVGASLRSPFVPTLRCDATDDLEHVVSQLNDFRPHVLVGYASILGVLANAQLNGSLRIRPRAVMSASELLTPATRGHCEQAWSAPVHDVYAATETAGIASPCLAGRRHTYDDLVILEPVDEQGRLVHDGEPAHRLLVTVLFSRTIPLIRYELTDSVTLGPAGCRCGRPQRTLLGIQGRTEDTMRLRHRDGTMVDVHPNVLHDTIDHLATFGWQVRYRDDHLRVTAVDASPSALDAIRTNLRRVVDERGLAVTVDVLAAAELARSRLGKTPLIAREPDA
jgi:phenylacetate-coenzyme A ligase PaaK-like adenylate-forming protein